MSEREDEQDGPPHRCVCVELCQRVCALFHYLGQVLGTQLSLGSELAKAPLHHVFHRPDKSRKTNGATQQNRKSGVHRCVKVCDVKYE